MEAWHKLELVDIPTCTSDVIEISNACEEISKRLKKLYDEVLKSTDINDKDELLDTIADIREDFIDCTDDENYVMYYNECVQRLYDLADMLITVKKDEMRFLELNINPNFN